MAQETADSGGSASHMAGGAGVSGFLHAYVVYMHFIGIASYPGLFIQLQMKGLGMRPSSSICTSVAHKRLTLDPHLKLPTRIN